MINFFAGLFALAFGFGLAFWICGNKLDKSNNIGDSRGGSKTYQAETTFYSQMQQNGENCLQDICAAEPVQV